MKPLILLVLLLVLPTASFAESFKFEDESGNIYFADSIAQIPMRYRDQVVQPPKFEGSAKDLEKYNKTLEQFRLKRAAEERKKEIAEAKRLAKEEKTKEKEARDRAKALKKQGTPDRRRAKRQDPELEDRRAVRIPND